LVSGEQVLSLGESQDRKVATAKHAAAKKTIGPGGGNPMAKTERINPGSILGVGNRLGLGEKSTKWRNFSKHLQQVATELPASADRND